MNIREVDDKPMVIHTKERPKVHGSKLWVYTQLVLMIGTYDENGKLIAIKTVPTCSNNC